MINRLMKIIAIKCSEKDADIMCIFFRAVNRSDFH